MQCSKWHIAVALACSAGGFSALKSILAALPADFPAPVIIALHRGDTNPEFLVQLLAGCTRLHVKSPAPMEALQAGCVYICPPGKHIEMATEHLLHTWAGPRIDFVRPSCDLLFNSMAAIFGARGICVVLTGCGHDGACATRFVRSSGGFVIAQDENSSAYPEMPGAAVELGRVDLILPLKDIPFALCGLLMHLTRIDAGHQQASTGISITPGQISDQAEVFRAAFE